MVNIKLFDRNSYDKRQNNLNKHQNNQMVKLLMFDIHMTKSNYLTFGIEVRMFDVRHSNIEHQTTNVSNQFQCPF